MKYWVQYLHKAVWPAGTDELIDVCGDRGVFILDGRNSQETMRQDALKFAQRMEHFCKYEAFKLVTGPRLFEETRRSSVHKLTYPIKI